ncbi:MAG: hypothetical protein FWE19_03420 [Oscillospiraceae bacterium]|nr:hypothetical protein [Oscillospiraceae bacterium]
MKITRNRKLIITLLLAAVIMFSGITAYADDWIIEPYRVESGDGSKVFYFNPLHDSSYPAMGVYYLNETSDSVYYFEITPTMLIPGDLIFSDDFQYAVLVSSSQNVALEFFANGALIRYYTIEDLVGNTDMVSMSVSMARWKNHESVGFDSVANALTLTTVDNLTYVFDITTGEIVEDVESGGLGRLGSTILVILSIGMAMGIVFLRAARNNHGSKRIPYR